MPLLFCFLHLPAKPQLGTAGRRGDFRFGNQSRIAGVCREISLFRVLELTLRVEAGMELFAGIGLGPYCAAHS